MTKGQEIMPSGRVSAPSCWYRGDRRPLPTANCRERSRGGALVLTDSPSQLAYGQEGLVPRHRLRRRATETAVRSGLTTIAARRFRRDALATLPGDRLAT